MTEMCRVPGERLRQLQEAEQALRELVSLKDGPRDSDYHHRKPAAWRRARRALDLPEDGVPILPGDLDG